MQIDDAEMDIRMSYDQRGKLGLEDVSPACLGVDYTFEIKSPASPEKIREMVNLIEKGCHTINTIRNPVPVSSKVIHNGAELDLKH